MSKGKRKHRLPRRHVEALKRALASAELKNCALPREMQERIELYLFTWVAPAIRAVLAWSCYSAESKRISP